MQGAEEEAAGIDVATKGPAYPFVPKSNRFLEAGQFWAIALSNGRFACGRVLDVPREVDLHIPVNTRMFLAGLLDWSGTEPPSSDRIAGSHLVDQGFAHIKAILTTGGEILGSRPLVLDRIVLMRWRSHVAGGTVWTFEGARRLRPATDADRDLPVMGTWGYSVIRLLAEERFIGRAAAEWMTRMELGADRRSRRRS